MITPKRCNDNDDDDELIQEYGIRLAKLCVKYDDLHKLLFSIVFLLVFFIFFNF